MASPGSVDDRPARPNVRLSLAGRAENVMLVRQMLAGLAEAAQVGAAELNDISTAVTEACNNVVLHAYGPDPGPLEVEIHMREQAIEVVVRDHGAGIQPPAVATGPGVGGIGGIGLSVIATLSARAEFREGRERGTEVWMTFPAPGARSLEPVLGDDPRPAGVGDTATEVEITIAPTRLARTILPRLLGAAAARSHFTTDRLADTQLLADALAGSFPETINGGRVRVGIAMQPRCLDIRIAPLHPGSASRLLQEASLHEPGPVLQKLATAHSVEAVDPRGDELLSLRVLDRRGGA